MLKSPRARSVFEISFGFLRVWGLKNENPDITTDHKRYSLSRNDANIGAYHISYISMSSGCQSHQHSQRPDTRPSYSNDFLVNLVHLRLHPKLFRGFLLPTLFIQFSNDLQMQLGNINIPLPLWSAKMLRQADMLKEPVFCRWPWRPTRHLSHRRKRKVLDLEYTTSYITKWL